MCYRIAALEHEYRKVEFTNRRESHVVGQCNGYVGRVINFVVEIGAHIGIIVHIPIGSRSAWRRC